MNLNGALCRYLVRCFDVQRKKLKAMTLNGDAFETYATFGGGAHGPANGNVVSNEDSSGKE